MQEMNVCQYEVAGVVKDCDILDLLVTFLIFYGNLKQNQ